MAQINIGRILPIFRGNWDSTTNYTKLDVVYYDNSSYVALADNTNTTPRNSMPWQLLVKNAIWDDLSEEDKEHIIVSLKPVINTAVSDIKKGVSTPDSIITPLYQESKYASGNVGSTLRKVDNANYKLNKYSVVEGEYYFITLNRRNENWVWCHFTDNYDNVIATAVTSSISDYSQVVDFIVEAPANATMMYIQSYKDEGLINAKTSKIDLANQVLSVSKFINNIKPYTLNNCDFNEDGYVYTEYLQVNTGDIITWYSTINKTEVSLTEYNSNKEMVDRWTYGTPRTITISNANTKYIRVKFGNTSNEFQYVTQNSKIIAAITLGGIREDVEKNKQDIATIKSELNDYSEVPSFVYYEARETYKRIIDWSGTDDVYLLGFVTDVHSGGNDKYKVVNYLNNINKIYSFNCLCNGGDIGLDTADTTGDENKVFKMMWDTRKGMNCTNPWIFCRGNHERLVNLQTIGNVFNRSLKRQFPNIVFGDNYGNYGYLDSNDLKVRTYFLNTTDSTGTTSYAITTTQLNWFVNSLNSLAEGWNVIITSHLCIDDIGRWKSYPSDASSNEFEALRRILKSFAARTSGSYANVSWNFTNAKANIVCSLAGDSHFNANIKRDGVNYIVRQGYGSISDAEMPSWGSKVYVDYNNTCCFDVLAVKSNGTAKIFRIGAGGSAYDLEITYSTTSESELPSEPEQPSEPDEPTDPNTVVGSVNTSNEITLNSLTGVELFYIDDNGNKIDNYGKITNL